MPQYQERPVEEPLDTGEASVDLAPLADSERLIDLIDKGIRNGQKATYTLGQLRDDELTLARIQLTADERKLLAGSASTLFELPERGQRVVAVRYNSVGSLHLETPESPTQIGALIAERKTPESLFRAKFEILDTGEVFVAATCFLEDRNERLRAQAMQAWAARWGLEHVWEVYDEYVRTHDLRPVTYKGPLTEKVANKSSATLEQLVA